LATTFEQLSSPLVKFKPKKQPKRWIFEIVAGPEVMNAANAAFSWKKRYATETQARQACSEWKHGSGGTAYLWPSDRWLGKVYED
jgi:hypothetical protein